MPPSSPGPMESLLLRLIDWLDTNADTIARLHAKAQRWQQAHPPALPAGMVTWPTRRRRSRR